MTRGMRARGLCSILRKHSFTFKVELPVPRWLIPDALIQWVVPRLIRKNFPVFTRVGIHFEESAFAERRRADVLGLHAVLEKRLTEKN